MQRRGVEAEYWAVPREFEGGTVAVFGRGPSLTASDVDKVRRAGIPAIAINDTFQLAPWAWMLYAADSKWWKSHPAALKFAGLKVSCEAYFPGIVMRLRNTGVEGFDPDPRCVRTGNNSGYQSVHVAIHAGAARVLLLGLDMRGGYYNGRPDGPVRRQWIGYFEGLAKEVAGKVRILTCTPSALTCFPYVPLDEALA